MGVVSGGIPHAGHSEGCLISDHAELVRDRLIVLNHGDDD